ncbi:hypothetical protein BH09DEP1_BH09DEP1_1430 [soil metagenome]
MKKLFLLLALLATNISIDANPFPAPCDANSRVTNNKPRASCGDACAMASKCVNNHGCNAKECVPFANCCRQQCGPFNRMLPGDYDSYKETTHAFWHVPPCSPRNDSKFRGYMYKGMWWDTTGVRFWAFRNSTNNTITIQALNGGEMKDLPAGDVVNIARGESYGFRVQAPARRFELFNSDVHHIEIFINLKGDIDYRAEPIALKTARKGSLRDLDVIPRF